MKVNTLVRHKKLKVAGIGCVAKVLKNTVRVNFGIADVYTCKPSALEVIDTSNCKTVTFHQFRSRILNSDESLNRCIVGNELKEYVGIGWITRRIITEEDLTKYPRVI